MPDGSAEGIRLFHQEGRDPEKGEVAVAFPTVLLEELLDGSNESIELIRPEVENLGRVALEDANVEVLEGVDEEARDGVHLEGEWSLWDEPLRAKSSSPLLEEERRARGNGTACAAPNREGGAPAGLIHFARVGGYETLELFRRKQARVLGVWLELGVEGDVLNPGCSEGELDASHVIVREAAASHVIEQHTDLLIMFGDGHVDDVLEGRRTSLLPTTRLLLAEERRDEQEASQARLC